MSLNQKQADFSLHIAQLIIWGHRNGHPVMGAEWYRTEYQAREYARLGKGIIQSNHRLKLAVDLFALDESGKVTWEQSYYEPLGWKWKMMHPLARWGGDFKNRDSVHFSFEHKGRA